MIIDLIKNYKRGLITALLCLFAMPALAEGTYSNDHMMYAIYWGTILVQDISIAGGLGLMIGSFFRFKRYGEQRTFMSSQMTLAKPLIMLIGGVALLATPVTVNTLLLAFWGSSSPLSYPVLSDANATEAVEVGIALIRFVGLIGVIRGIFLFTRAGGEQSQPGTIGKATLHLLGGLLCLHIINVWDIIAYILDFDY